MMDPQKKQYAMVDVMKFVFACFIILLHLPSSMSRPTWLTYDYANITEVIRTFVVCPVMRLGVPFFFTASGYFLFRKAERAENKKQVIITYIKRSLILYGIWFVINIVYVVECRGLNFFMPGHQTIGNLLHFIHEFLFASTFGASWFLMACMIDAMILGIVLYGIKSEKLAWIISIAGFIICCMTTNYSPLSECNYIGRLILKIDSRIIDFHLSFLCGLIYFMIGRAIGKYESSIKISTKKLCLITVAAFLLMIAEFLFLDKVVKSDVIGNTSLMLPVVAALLMILCIKCETEYKQWYSFLRNASIIMYCSHRSVFMCLKIVSERYFFLSTFAVYILCITICLTFAWIIIGLSRKYKIFKYLY